MNAYGDAREEETRFNLEVVARWGRYTDPGAPSEIRRLTHEGRLREAFEVAEVAAGPWPREGMFWFSMKDVAAALGLDERAAHWERRMEDADVEDEAYIEALHSQIVSAVASGCTVRDGMLQVIELCAAARPEPDWRQFEARDYEADVRRLRRWLEGVLDAEPPPDEVDGLWFGLFNPIRDGEPTADMYVSGGVEDPEDREAGFPYQLLWTPEATDATSAILDDIYKIAYRGGVDEDGWTAGLGNDAEYPLCLAYGCLVAGWLIANLPSELILGAARERVVEVGFDSGDSLRIATVSEQGLSSPE